MGHDILYQKLRAATAREICGALLRDGFYLKRQSGSHRHYVHSDGRRVTVTFHSFGQTFPRKTLRSMVEIQAQWTREDLRRLDILDS